MRKTVSALTLAVILSTALPLAAAPSRNSNEPPFFARIIKFVQRLVTPLDLAEPSPPKP